MVSDIPQSAWYSAMVTWFGRLPKCVRAEEGLAYFEKMDWGRNLYTRPDLRTQKLMG